MIGLEAPLFTQAHHTQTRGHRTLSWGEDRTDEQYLNPFPGLLAEQQFKGSEHVYNLRWQVAHDLTLSCRIRQD